MRKLSLPTRHLLQFQGIDHNKLRLVFARDTPHLFGFPKALARQFPEIRPLPTPAQTNYIE